MTDPLNDRIRDRLSVDWLTTSQKNVWEAIRRFDGPPHRVIDIFGPEGCGKTFMGWLMEREQYATYALWAQKPAPVLPRLIFDNAPSHRAAERGIRPLVDSIPGLQQIILLTRTRVNEIAIPCFELRVTDEDWEHFRSNLFRHLSVNVAETNLGNFSAALEGISGVNHPAHP